MNLDYRDILVYNVFRTDSGKLVIYNVFDNSRTYSYSVRAILSQQVIQAMVFTLLRKCILSIKVIDLIYR